MARKALLKCQFCPMRSTRMAERVQTNMKELAEKNDRLDAILDAMIEPVIAVGEHCTVTFMNAPAKKIFGRSASSELAVYPLVLMTHSQETENLVKKALNSGETVGAEISLDTEYGVRDFQVTASPVGSDQPDGVIITFTTSARSSVRNRCEASSWRM